MRVGGANEVDFDWCDVASFDKSRGSVGDGREKGSCCNGEDLHVDWILGEMGIFLKEGFVVDWYVWEGFVWSADEMEVCRGYVGVFIDSPDSQTHDPSPLRNYAKDWRAFLLLRWASGINSPHPSQDGMNQASLSSLFYFFGRVVFLLNASESGCTIPLKNCHLNRTKIRFAHLWEVTIPYPPPPPPLPVDWYG